MLICTLQALIWGSSGSHVLNPLITELDCNRLSCVTEILKVSICLPACLPAVPQHWLPSRGAVWYAGSAFRGGGVAFGGVEVSEGWGMEVKGGGSCQVSLSSGIPLRLSQAFAHQPSGMDDASLKSFHSSLAAGIGGPDLLAQLLDDS